MVKYRTEYSGDKIELAVLAKKAGRPIVWSTFKVKPAYSGKLPLKPALKEDLKWYFDKGHIPTQYHNTYLSLMAAPAAEDSDPEEDMSEDVDEPDEPGEDTPVWVDPADDALLADIPNCAELEDGWEVTGNEQQETGDEIEEEVETDDEVQELDSSDDDNFD